MFVSGKSKIFEKNNFWIYFVGPFFSKILHQKMKKSNTAKIKCFSHKSLSKIVPSWWKHLVYQFYLDTSTILVKMTKKWPKIGKILKCRLTGRLSVDQHHVTCCIENTLLWLSIQLFSYKEASYTLQNDNGRTYMHIIGYFCSISLNLRARYWRL